MKARIIVGLALVFTILALPLARNAFSAQELQPGPPPGVAPEGLDIADCPTRLRHTATGPGRCARHHRGLLSHQAARTLVAC